MSAFVAVQTQWRTRVMPTGRVIYCGLDYAGVAAGLALAGIALTPDQWDELQLVERAAMRELNQ